MLLIEQNCTACNANSEKLNETDVANLLEQLISTSEGWELIESNGVQKLSRQFITKRYNRSMTFCNRVAELAETVNHHPLMIVEYGEVTVEWWSHNINGLHLNDFIMAAKTSALYSL